MAIRQPSSFKAGVLSYLAALCLVLSLPTIVFAVFIGVQFVDSERARLQAQAQELARSVRTTISPA